jgi:hypothetical protein
MVRPPFLCVLVKATAGSFLGDNDGASPDGPWSSSFLFIVLDKAAVVDTGGEDVQPE